MEHASRKHCGLRSLGSNLEEDTARCKERAIVDNLRHDVGELIGGRDEENLDVAVLDEPAKVVLPAEKVGSLRSHTELTTQIVGSGVVDQRDCRFSYTNFELCEKLNNVDLALPKHAASSNLCFS